MNKTGSLELIKKLNRSLVLETIRNEQPISRAAVAKKLPEFPDGSRILTFCYDSGERYLSVDGLF